jgi:hypothetical protein
VPIVYVLAAVFWAVLLAAEFVFLVPVAIAVAMLGGFGLGLYRFFQTAWRTLTVSGLDGPSPVSRPAPGPPDAAYPHYLLLQVWRDAWTLERRTVPWCVTQARWAISTLTETLLKAPLGLVLFPVWLGLCGGIALAAVPLAVAALAFGVATALMAGAGLAVWSVCVVVLGTVERVWMAYRRILIACPHAGCYRRFALPEYACPNCEERHARLMPGRLGAFRHVCRCGTRLPTTILLGRFRLGAYCPHCHRRLPGRIGRARVEPLPFVGGPAAGKTTLMFLAVRALRASAAGAQGRAEFVEARDARAYAGAVAELDRGARLAKTGPELPVATMLDLTLPTAHRILYLFDPAGELHTGATHVERLRYLDHGEALLFVIDPFALPELRLALSTDERRIVEEATATSDEDPADTLQRLLAELRSRDDQGRQRRIAVVVTKADVVRQTSAGRGLDGDARGWLEGLGLGNTIRTLERTAGEVRYFASGLDSPPSALADLFGWAAGLPLGGGVDPAFDDRPTTDELREPWPVAGRPAEQIPSGHRFGRHTLLASLTVLGPVMMLLLGLSVYARLR